MKSRLDIVCIQEWVARIYDLTQTELQHVLSTVPLVKDSIKAGVLDEFQKPGG